MPFRCSAAALAGCPAAAARLMQNDEAGESPPERRVWETDGGQCCQGDSVQEANTERKRRRQGRRRRRAGMTRRERRKGKEGGEKRIRWRWESRWRGGGGGESLSCYYLFNFLSSVKK